MLRKVAETPLWSTGVCFFFRYLLFYTSNMKPGLIISCLVLSTSARRLSGFLQSFRGSDSQLHIANEAPNVAMPPSADDNAGADFSTGVIISDVIGKSQEIAIFSSLTRDIDSVSSRLEDAAQNATVLAPDNSVMKSLPRKPWEDPRDYEAMGESAYRGQSGEDRAHRNLRRFVEAHIVPESPWKENQKIKTLTGSEIWYEHKGGKTLVRYPLFSTSKE